jgi:predicted Zn-dependent protease
MLMLLAARALAQSDDPVFSALDTELQRTMAAWQGAPDAPYYLGYRVTDATHWSVAAIYGALSDSQESRSRWLDVSARVGSPALDNTHPIRERFNWDFDWQDNRLPLDGSALALRTSIWRSTSDVLRAAQERILRVRANRAVKVEEEDPSPDFTVEKPVVSDGGAAAVQFDRAGWEPVVVDLSRRLNAAPEIEWGRADVTVNAGTAYVVASDGTRVREPHVWARVALSAKTTASDGMDLTLYRWVDVHDPTRLPGADVLVGWADALRTDLVALREAPKGDPWSGPVILRGRAAGVFVHEVLGHRVEGHRQKKEDEGQTFRKMVGQKILPAAISIVDDPTLSTLAGQELNGFYAFDEEGQPAQRAVLVDHGVFQGFLMSRSPIEGFDHSNGHGRAQPGMKPVSRMANTILETTAPMPYGKLREQLLAEVKRLGLPYGLVVDELAGGFTMTGRVQANSFNIRAVTAWRIYPDGRPDQLIRGIDLVGTPLVALGNVVAAGDDPGVFNGWCGAESGSVPNAAVSPSLFIKSLEVQRKEKAQDRPPLLPRPDGKVKS